MSNEIVLLRRIEELEKLIQRQPEVGGVWQNWTPTPTGYSSTTTAAGRYCLVGKLCTVHLRLDGTSNSTSFSAVLPFKAGALGYTLYISSALAIDSAALVKTASTFIIVAGGTSVLFGKGITTSAATWTASGRKLITGSFSYEIA